MSGGTASARATPSVRLGAGAGSDAESVVADRNGADREDFKTLLPIRAVAGQFRPGGFGHRLMAAGAGKRQDGGYPDPRSRTMIRCEFELNGQPMSEFTMGARRVPAFSGLGRYANQRRAACLRDLGPIPPGRYDIVDRESGGRLGWLRALFNEKRDWFALYAADGHIDDKMFCDAVVRGHFRLHPNGPLGISKGCITIERAHDFHAIRRTLLGAGKHGLPDHETMTYGMVTVR